MIDWNTIILLGMLMSVVIYVITLYHRAHGNERRAVELGAKIVVDALIKDGRIMAKPAERETDAVNIDEEDYAVTQDDYESPVPDIITARSQAHADQIGDRLLRETMAAMDREDIKR